MEDFSESFASSLKILVLIFATAFIINVPCNVIKSCYQEKAALPTSVPMLPIEINGHINVDFRVFKKQTSEGAICQSLNNPRMGFSVLYKSRNSKSTILKPDTTMFSKGLLTVFDCLFCGSWELRCR